MTTAELLHNPLVIGSLGLSAGSIIGYFRGLSKRFSSFFERFFTCSVQVSNMDDEETFRIARQWMSSLEYAKKTRNLTAIMDNGSWILTPAPGNHFFWFEGRAVWMRRERGNVSSDLKTMALKFPETITLRAFTRNKSVVERLCQKIQDYGASMKMPDGHMRIYTACYSSWDTGGARAARSLNSVVLPSGEMERITSDLESFWANEEWYREMGVPYRRGWLLQGTPGSGKTSLVAALAGHYKRDVYILNLSDPDLSDTKLLSLVGSIKKGALMLLEDIDAADAQRESKEAKGITFSGLLNALDGVASPDGVVTFMTTNHPEKLDPALIRPGRIDKTMNFSTATEDQLKRLHERFSSPDEQGWFVDAFRDKTISEAQAHLLGAAA